MRGFMVALLGLVLIVGSAFYMPAFLTRYLGGWMTQNSRAFTLQAVATIAVLGGLVALGEKKQRLAVALIILAGLLLCIICGMSYQDLRR